MFRRELNLPKPSIEMVGAFLNLIACIDNWIPKF